MKLEFEQRKKAPTKAFEKLLQFAERKCEQYPEYTPSNIYLFLVKYIERNNLNRYNYRVNRIYPRSHEEEPILVLMYGSDSNYFASIKQVDDE